MPPTVSLCVMTPGPPERVRALLRCCRDAVDEIVLVGDARGGTATLDACADLADRRLLVESSSITDVLGGMLLQCRSDWILRLDDDEIPSAALLEHLPDLVSAPFPTNVALPRRWLHPSPDAYVTTPPWIPDHQVRLIRNVPGIWSFPGTLHAALRIEGDRRLAAEPIYHADALLRPVEERRSKRDRFEARRPGIVTAGLGVNELYVPEDHGVETAPVPDADRALIGRVLDGDPVGRRRRRDRGEPIRVVAAEELGRLVATREVTEGAYRAAIALEDPMPRLPAGATRHVRVVVTNLGDDWWPAGDVAPHIRLGLRWLDPATEDPAGHEDRVLFTERVLPGATTRVDLRILAPAAPGRYLLEVDVVHEEARWFGCALRVPVDVGPG